MRSVDYRVYLGVAFALLLGGVILPFLMVLRILPSTFLLNFLAYGMSVTGLLVGIIGAAQVFRVLRSRDDDDRRL